MAQQDCSQYRYTRGTCADGIVQESEARFLSATVLNNGASKKATGHVEVDLAGAGKTLEQVLTEDMSLSPAPDMLFELISTRVGGESKPKAKALAHGEDPDGDAATLNVLAAILKFPSLQPDPEAFVECRRRSTPTACRRLSITRATRSTVKVAHGGASPRPSCRARSCRARLST